MKKQECRLIFSKSDEDLDSKCIELIKSDIEKTDVENILIISDDKYKKELEVKIRKKNIIDENLKLNIVTIQDLVQRELTKRGDKRLKLISSEQAKVIITHLLYTNKSKLKNYKVVDSGLISKFIDTIELLKGAGISHNDIKSDLLNEDSLFMRKIHDIALIYSEYEEFKLNKFLDKYDQLFYYSKLIENDTTYSNLYLHKFSNMNNAELRAVKSIKIKDLNIIVNTDSANRVSLNDSGHFYKIDCYINKVFKEFNINKDEVENIKIDTTKNDNKELNLIRDELYKYPNNTLNENTQNIFLTEYDSISNEIEALIKTLKNIDNKYSTSIAVTNLEEYGEVIRRELTNNEILFNMDTTLTLNTHPIYKILSILIDCKTNITLSKFIQILKTDYLNVNKNDIYKLENYIKDNSLLNDSSLSNIDLEELSSIENLNQIISLYEEVEKLIEIISNKYTFDDYMKSILDFFSNNGVLSKIKDIINFELEQENTSLTKLSWENFVKKINTYSTVLPSDPIDSLEFEIILRDIISETLPVKDRDNKGITVTDINSLQSCDVVFLIGANKGAIQNVVNNTLLSEDDILKLNKYEMLINEDYISKYLQSQYDLYLLLTKAKEKLFISYSTKGLNLSKKEKAPFINRLQSIFSNLSYYGTYWNYIDCNVPYSTINDITQFIRENYNDTVCENYIDRIKEEVDNKYLSDIEAIQSACNYNNRALCLNKYNIQNLYYSDFLSVSKLEKYARCPFSFFLEYGLKLKKVEENTLQAKHIGIALHSIIEEFDKRLRKSNISWSSLTDEDICENISDIISKLDNRGTLEVFHNTYSSKYYLKRMKELAISSVKAIRCHIGNSFFEIEGHEIDFNDRGNYPPISIKMKNGKIIKLQGQIDRLDKLKGNDMNYIRIVDYKTGNTSLDFTEIAHGTQLQLLTYLDAILGSDSNNSTAGVFYFKLDDPIIKITPNTLDDYINESRQKEMKLNGLFTDNEDTVKAMDKGIFDGEYNSSINIKARFKTDGTLSKTTPGLPIENFNILREYTKKNIEKLATRMLVDCEIDIHPIKKKSIIPCTYCDYKTICHFDETLDVNKFKILNEYSKDELIELAYKKVGIDNE